MLSPLIATLAACGPGAQDASPGVGGTTVRTRFYSAPYNDPGGSMAASLARVEGIPLAEATRRLKLQHAGGDLAGRLRERYGDRFVGASFDRKAPFLVRYVFAGLNPEVVRAALPGLHVSPELLPLIRIERAEHTEAEMRAIAQSTTGQLKAMGIEGGSVAYSATTGDFKILTTDVEKATKAVREGQITGGRIVGVEYFDGIQTTPMERHGN
jgi:hypothetical protein